MRPRVPARLRSHAGAASIAVIAAAFSSGCSRADSAADRHLAEMRDAIGSVQAEQDRANQRFALLEDSRADEKPARAAKAGRPLSPPRTVQLGDTSSAAESDDPDDPNARPEIRLQGSSRGKISRARSSEREEMFVQPSDERGPRPSIMDPDAKRAYDDAYALVTAKQYDRALDALAGFLVRWPDHPYAENALYWRGEVYFARGEHQRAVEQFEAVLARFGGGNKAPDALLKIGMCHDRLGSPDRAKQSWDRLRSEFPRSDAAKKIPQSEGDSRNRGVGPKENR